ncbi:hypothetical protein [Frigoribacterium sp. Leaf44]|uniref:hypothetical protein n=1 Tax=Frigoribacterium sp. Leaf44 TaxID=1736220 RepID=UPI00351384E1
MCTPSPTLVGDPAPLTTAAERTDGTAVTGRLVVDYVAAPAPAGDTDAAASGVLAWTGSNAGTVTFETVGGTSSVAAGLAFILKGRRRSQH